MHKPQKGIYSLSADERPSLLAKPAVGSRITRFSAGVSNIFSAKFLYAKAFLTSCRHNIFFFNHSKSLLPYDKGFATLIVLLTFSMYPLLKRYIKMGTSAFSPWYKAKHHKENISFTMHIPNTHMLVFNPNISIIK